MIDAHEKTEIVEEKLRNAQDELAQEKAKSEQLNKEQTGLMERLLKASEQSDDVGGKYSMITEQLAEMTNRESKLNKDLSSALKDISDLKVEASRATSYAQKKDAECAKLLGEIDTLRRV